MFLYEILINLSLYEAYITKKLDCMLPGHWMGLCALYRESKSLDMLEIDECIVLPFVDNIPANWGFHSLSCSNYAYAFCGCQKRQFRCVFFVIDEHVPACSWPFLFTKPQQLISTTWACYEMMEHLINNFFFFNNTTITSLSKNMFPYIYIFYNI